MNARAALERFFLKGLDSVDPEKAVSRALRFRGTSLELGRTRLNLKRVRRICALGAGKAATGMLRGLITALPRPIDAGLIITNEIAAVQPASTAAPPLCKGRLGGVEPSGLSTSPTPSLQRRGGVRIMLAGHPVPDRNGLAAARKLLDLAASAGPDDLAFVLISGGASAMTPAPAPGLSLADIRKTTRLLLVSGAPIHEVNIVRRRLSRIAGGQLARVLFPAASITLLLSDVIGDDLEAIGSGPTVPDPSTFQDAWDVLSRLDLLSKVPHPVLVHLRAGKMGLVSETPKPRDPVFKSARTAIVASNRTMLDAAAKAAREEGLSAEILTDALQGEARDVGAILADLALVRSRVCRRPLILLAGGETTVRVHGKGTGGRNQEMALAFADRIRGIEGITALFAGTDGKDGNSASAGGWADGGTAALGERARGVSIARVLAANNSTPFLRAAKDLFVTGPTGTNVRDVVMIRMGKAR